MFEELAVDLRIEAEVYHFKPLNERVDVYQKPFRIVQDVAVDASPDAQAALKDVSTMTITRTLSYPACDDRICFWLQRVLLAWPVSMRPLDRIVASRSKSV